MSSDLSAVTLVEDMPTSGIHLFDSHAHYFDARMDAEYPGGAKTLLPQLFNAYVDGIMNVGTSPSSSLAALKQAESYNQMYAAVGIHPEDAHGLSGRMEDHLETIQSMALGHPQKVKAIGEIGLDYYREEYCGKPIDKQMEKAYFDAQLSLSERLHLPVIIHDRDAHGDCVEMVMAHPNAYGVFHSFSGSAETAKELWKRGWFISFSGVITFKNATRVADVVKVIPDEWLLIETDCPYLAPHPFRGRMNHSGLMLKTAERMAQIRETSIENVAQLTLSNAKRLFSI